MEDDAKELYNMLWQLPERSSHNPSPESGHPETGQPGRARGLGGGEERRGASKPPLRKDRGHGRRVLFSGAPEPHHGPGQCNSSARRTYDGTLLDGEWMGDRILVFDAVVVAGYSKRKKPFSARLAAARDFLGSVSMEGISVSVKAFVPVREIARLVKDIKAGTKGKCDGLVFMPEKDWVATGRAQNIFKWKPVNLNTIDLRYDGAAWYTSGGFEPYPLSLEGPPRLPRESTNFAPWATIGGR